MGGTLSYPITTMHVERHHNAVFNAACAHVHGWRLTQEDAHNMIESVNDKGIMLFGVYDGHGGSLASKYLHLAVPKAFSTITNIYDYPAITKLMLDLDKEFLVKGHQDGTTCCIVLAQLWNIQLDTPIEMTAEEYLKSIDYDIDYMSRCTAIKLISVNIGDSRAMIINSHAIYKHSKTLDTTKTKKESTPDNTTTKDTTTAPEKTIEKTSKETVTKKIGNLGDKKQTDYIAITRDHKPQHDIERQRIVNAMGTVTSNRVDGNLALSRAIGDYPYKNDPNLSAVQQKVIAVPDFEEHTIYWGDVLLVCCDGIFEADRMTYAEVSRIICKSIQDMLFSNTFVQQPTIINEDEMEEKCEDKDANKTATTTTTGTKKTPEQIAAEKAKKLKMEQDATALVTSVKSGLEYERMEWDPAVVARDLIEQSLLAESKDNHSAIIVSFRLPKLRKKDDTNQDNNTDGTTTTTKTSQMTDEPATTTTSTTTNTNDKKDDSNNSFDTVFETPLLARLPLKEVIPGPYRAYSIDQTFAKTYKQDLEDNGFKFDNLKPLIDLLDDVVAQYSTYDTKNKAEVISKLADAMNKKAATKDNSNKSDMGPILIKNHFRTTTHQTQQSNLNLNSFFHAILQSKAQQAKGPNNAKAAKRF